MASSILQSAVSGLHLNAQRVGAAADNIANVSTNGYKDTQILARSVTTAQGTSPTYAPGGVQAISRQLADVQGLLAPSATSTDLALSGAGFFAVSRTSDPVSIQDASAGKALFTRDGSFAPDSEGFLVNSSGFYLLGQKSSGANGVLSAVNVSRVGDGADGNVTGVSVSAEGRVTALFDNGNTSTISDIPVAVFTHPAGLAAETGGVFHATDFSGRATFFKAGSDRAGAIQSGALELSTTDIGTEFSNMIMAQSAYKASLSVIKVADEMSRQLLDETA
ncbi:MAG: flagellar hook basal-body protein [Magnetovibrio sp.]|nr:flagellar hook basal-body protein [Magnetovibrio sp.]